LIQRLGEVPEPEMYRVFNMGVGMILFVAPDEAQALIQELGEGFNLGEVVEGDFGLKIKP
jgi:phosphoribosylformylglycinamidine cyclo-ligase